MTKAQEIVEILIKKHQEVSNYNDTRKNAIKHAMLECQGIILILSTFISRVENELDNEGISINDDLMYEIDIYRKAELLLKAE